MRLPQLHLVQDYVAMRVEPSALVSHQLDLVVASKVLYTGPTLKIRKGIGK